MPGRTLDDIYAEFHGRILRYVRRYVGDDAAEDVTQSVFIKVFQSLDEFEGTSSLGTWIYRIATNAALDHVRSEAAAGRKLAGIADSPLAAAGAGMPPGGSATAEGKAELREMRA